MGRARDAGRTLLHNGLTKIRIRRANAVLFFVNSLYGNRDVGYVTPAAYNGKGYLKRFGFIEAGVFR